MQTRRLFTVLIVGLGALLVLLVGLRTAQAGSTAGLVRYVATTGRDAIPIGSGLFILNDCTAATDPCQTVQHAVNQAAPSDEIRVATGVYTGVQARDGMTQVVYIAKSVTIHGGYTTTNWGASFPLTQPTTLDAQGLGRVVAITGNVTPALDSLVIARGNAAGQTAECPTNHGAASGCGGGIFIYAAHPLVVNNVITNNVASDAASGTGYGGGLYLKNAHGAVISGNIIISNAARLTGFGDGGGLHLNSSNAQVRANQFLNNYATLQNTNCWGGGISANYGAPTVEGNVLRGNWVNPSGTNYSGAAIYLWNDSGTYSGNQIAENHGQSAIGLSRGQPRLESNQVISNATTIGVELFSGPGAATLVNNIVARSGTQVIRAEGQSGQPLTATLIHNTLVGPGGGSDIYAAGYTTLFVINTIAVSATWGITNVSPASATVVADHNLFWANTYPGIQGTNPVSGNPRFINPAGGDYHLGPGSAAIDAGVNAGVTSDIDGEARPHDSGYDIGADERVCHSLSGVDVAGPPTKTLGLAAAFTASAVPVTATLPVIYIWQASGQPSIVHNGGLSDTATFTWTTPGARVITVTAANCGGAVSATRTITIVNQPPVADAGPDQTVKPNTTVTLDGSGSYDPDGHYPLTYGWAQTGGPAVPLSAANGVSPTFTAPGTPAVLTFTLTVTDSYGLSDPTPDEVVVTVEAYRIYLPLVLRN